jgi:hypothetical protein
VYLQGLLTNDIQALTPGAGCYAAWLTPQGRMLTDVHLFESGDMILMDVPVRELPASMQRLDQFLFGEDVRSFVRAEGRMGRACRPLMLKQVLGANGLASWSEYHNASHVRGACCGRTMSQLVRDSAPMSNRPRMVAARRCRRRRSR